MRRVRRRSRTSGATASLRGLKVMVVDDDLRHVRHDRRLLVERRAPRCELPSAARDALRVMDTWVPDILVSDLAMPGDDGFGSSARSAPAGRRKADALIAVALTAYGRSEDRAKALSAGFQMHPPKPVAPSHLVNVVASATGHTRH